MKRLTKAQKEALELATLTQRLRDMYAAANYGWVDGDLACAEVIERVMCAVRQTFLKDKTDDFRVRCHMIAHYDNPEKAAHMLYLHGVRA